MSQRLLFPLKENIRIRVPELLSSAIWLLLGALERMVKVSVTLQHIIYYTWASFQVGFICDARHCPQYYLDTIPKVTWQAGSWSGYRFTNEYGDSNQVLRKDIRLLSFGDFVFFGTVNYLHFPRPYEAVQGRG